MYSAVIMLAMAGAPETPSFHGLLSCLFHCPTTCYSYPSYYSCWNSHAYSNWSGCYGSGCYSSGCYGSGCYGSGYGCSGYGIYGGATYSWPNSGSCYGYGGGCYGANPYGYGMPMMPTTPKIEEIPAPKKEAPKGGTSYIPQLPGQARVIVQLPADAKLYADGVETTLTSSRRNFVTPILEKGKDFQYEMKIEYRRGGETFSATKRVKVRADSVVSVDFSDAKEAELASSKFIVKLPQGAKLYVDGAAKVVPPQGEFRTPELIKGNEYVYHFKAELDSNGAKQTQTQRVVFKAGEPVRVDFSDMIDVSRVSQK